MSNFPSTPKDIGGKAIQYGDEVGISHNGGRPCLGENCIYCNVNSSQGAWDDECMGKILTLIDASIVDERQNKSMKDLLKQIYRTTQWEKSVSIEKAIARSLSLDKGDFCMNCKANLNDHAIKDIYVVDHDDGKLLCKTCAKDKLA